MSNSVTTTNLFWISTHDNVCRDQPLQPLPINFSHVYRLSKFPFSSKSTTALVEGLFIVNKQNMLAIGIRYAMTTSKCFSRIDAYWSSAWNLLSVSFFFPGASICTHDACNKKAYVFFRPWWFYPLHKVVRTLRVFSHFLSLPQKETALWKPIPEQSLSFSFWCCVSVNYWHTKSIHYVKSSYSYLLLTIPF